MSDAAPDDRAQSIVESLRSDHTAIAELLDDPRAVAGDDEAAALREQLVMTTVRHLVAEEQYLYPTVREQLVDGDASADEGLTASRETEHDLRLLEDTELTDASLRAVIAQLSSRVEQHVAHQEPLFAELEARCPPDLLNRLGEDVRGAERVAPTSPRRLPTANKFLGVVEGFVDQVRDHYTRRGVDTD